MGSAWDVFNKGLVLSVYYLSSNDLEVFSFEK